MKNALDDTDRADILRRLEGLTPESQRRWGTLTAPEMLCHLKDHLNVALGNRPVPFRGNWLLRLPLVSKILLYLFPWGKAQLETPREMDPKRGGSQPGDFGEDKAETRRLLNRFVEIPEEEIAPHPLFGPLSKRDWGRATWRNFDHHLRQFGL